MHGEQPLPRVSFGLGTLLAVRTRHPDDPMDWLLAGSVAVFRHACWVASTSSFHVLNLVASGMVKLLSTVVKKQRVTLFSSDELTGGVGPVS